MTRSEHSGPSASESDAHVSRVPRVLYIHPGPVPPSDDPVRNATAQWADRVDGTLLMPTWSVVAPTRPIQSHKPHGLNGNSAFFLPGAKTHTWFSAPWRMVEIIQAGRALGRREGGFDIVMAYGTLATGLSAWVLSRLMRVPLIIEFPGHPFRGILHAGGRGARLRVRVARRVATFLVRRARHVKLLYPSQIDELPVQERPTTTISHDFVPVGLVPYTPETDAPEILLMGYPWHLKGVDLLIKAFLQIADRHPDVTLRVIGHCPDRAPFERLAAGHPRVSLEKAVFSEEAYAAISRCRVFVLASRTEAMGRVLLEAMAAGRPIVASRVDGIPHYVEDGVNGLLFESENVADLAEKLDRVLSDAELRRTLGANGRRIVMEQYSEAAYARSMVTMFYETLGREPPADLPGAPPPPRHPA